MITHILFDLDDTIFDYRRAQKHSLALAFRQLEIEPAEKLMNDYEKFNQELWKALERGEITQSQLKIRRFERLLRENGMDTSKSSALNSCYTENLSRSGFLLDGAAETLERLSGKYVLAAATNGIPYVQHGRLANSGVEKYFSKVFISEEVGYTKPDVRFFDAVMRGLGAVGPKEIFFVGDSPSADIAGGNAAGMITCLVGSKICENDGNIVPDYRAASVKDVVDILENIRKNHVSETSV